MYSQYGEEIFLKSYFKDKIGLVVEIGAADGISNSNSRMLIENGWKALLVEPNINNYNKIQKLYENNSNISIENIGCSNKNEIATFFIDNNDEYQQLSTFSQNQVKRCKEMYNCDFTESTVKLVKTSELFEKYNLDKIDFLSIDTEGFDENVLNGINFDKIYIDIICIECDSNVLKNLGYELVYQTIGNYIYKKIN